MIGDKINLRELFTKSISELPSWVRQDNIIYLIKNLRNGKGYVGQARSFPSRFIYPGLMSHFTAYVNCCIDGPKYYQIVYRALRKYKSRNFEVSILEELDTPELLNEKEEYWIRKLHTCIYDSECWGYNMNWGGSNCTQLRKALLRLYPDTNGAPPQFIEAGRLILLKLYPETNGTPPQFIEAGHRRLKELYPDTNGLPYKCIENSHLPEVEERRLQTNRDNHGGVLAWHTEEAREKQRLVMDTPEMKERVKETQRRNHGGVLAFNTPEAYETQRRNHGGVLACHTEEAIETQKRNHEGYFAFVCPEALLTRTFSWIGKTISKIESKGLEVNFYNLYFNFGGRLWETVVKSFFDLQKDERWDHRLDCFLDEMYWDEERQKLELKPEVRNKYTNN